MKDTEKLGVDLTLTRRQMLGSVGAAAGAATVLSMAPWADVQAEVDKLKEEGWEAHPCACNVCGGYCGLLALHKKGTPVSRETVRIMPNPSHPQRGCCARGAGAMWTWDNPLRLRKPLKRVGERGEGKFEEISWDQALTEIAQKVKAIVEKDGERAVSMTTHNFKGQQSWLQAGIGTPNLIMHSSTCNSASIAGRRFVFGKGFDGAGKVEPDYENCHFLLLMGRTLNCAIGVHSVVSRARAEKGTRVVFVDPRMPEGALTGSKWLAIRPGTDGALLQAMLNIAINEKLANFDFLAKHTNAPYLVTADQKPVTEAMLREGGRANYFAVRDSATGEIRFQGMKKNEAGEFAGFDEDPSTKADLYFAGSVPDVSGNSLDVKTAFVVFAETCAPWTPEKAASVTAIPAGEIIQLTRDFFTQGGVVDDGWYGSRNGNDSEIFALICCLNVFTGSLDRKGGFVVTQGAGMKGVSASYAADKGQGKSPTGKTWKQEGGEKKALDKVLYPESSGTYSAIFDAIETGKPYPIRATFITGSTMFHREANSDRLAKALKALDLVVVQDILPHEVMDYADYVLPCTFFLEWHEYAGVKWNINGNVQINDAGIDPPSDCDAREEIWQFCEIIRRAWPERAAERLSYDKEIKTREEFKKWYYAMVDKAWNKFIAGLNEKKAGEGDRVAADVAKQGWSCVKKKAFDVFPYKKPFGTMTGKPEILSFLVATKYQDKGLHPVPQYFIPKEVYQQPKPNSDEFYLVSGKDSSSSSGVSMFNRPTEFLGDRSVWMNPVDGERLGLETGDTIELEALHSGVKGRAKVKLTNRVIAGSLFAYSFSGGVRTKTIKDPRYNWVREGINSHWFCTGYREPVVGGLSNNTSVRVKRV